MFKKDPRLKGVFLKSGSYWLQRKVPEHLREIVGQANLMFPLKTDSPRTAIKRVEAARQIVERQLADAQRKFDGEQLSDIQQALAFKELIDAFPDAGADTDWLELIERERGLTYALRMNQIIRGTATPIAEIVERQLLEEPTGTSDTKLKRHMVKVLEAAGLHSIEEVDRKKAADFISELLKEGSRSRATVNKYVATIRSIWAFALRRGIGDHNPWSNQRLKGTKTKKRAFTRDELEAFLRASREPYRSLFIVLALSGLRIGELLSLKPEDVKAGFMEIQRGKSEAASRRVPVHPRAKDNLERFFSERWSYAQCARVFRVTIERCGLEPELFGLHSLRKYFYSEADKNGAPKLHLEKVVGHQVPVLYETYSRGPTDDQLRDVVYCVSLPDFRAMK